MSRIALLALRDECFCTRGPFGSIAMRLCGKGEPWVSLSGRLRSSPPTPSTFDDAVLLSVADASPLLVAIMTGAQLALLKQCQGYLRTKKYHKSGVFLRGAQVTRARILQAVPYPSSTRKTKDIREPPMLKDLAREVEAHPVGDSWYWKIGKGGNQDKLK